VTDNTDLIKAAAEGGAEGIIRTLFSPFVETGEWSADLVRRRRVRTQIKTARMTKQMLEKSGLAASFVPSKTLVPLLEMAGLEDEDDEEMTARWAALLANAATEADGAPKVMPSFAQMLGELTAVEARMLDDLYNSAVNELHLDRFLEVAGLRRHATSGQDWWREWEKYMPYVENLERLNLIEVERRNKRLDEVEKQIGGRRGVNSEKVHLTSLGRAFVAACTPPSAARPDGRA